MARYIVYGVEKGYCGDPNDAGCGHPIRVHSVHSWGCSVYFDGGRRACLCLFKPERTGAAELLEWVVSQQSPWPQATG